MPQAGGGGDEAAETAESGDSAGIWNRHLAKISEKEYDNENIGVMLDDSGNVTYHANYTGCEDKSGIMANSAEELLEKLRIN